MRIFAVFRSQQDLYYSYNIVSFIVQTIIYVISEGIFSSTKDFHYTRLNTENMPRFLEAYFVATILIIVERMAFFMSKWVGDGLDY